MKGTKVLTLGAGREVLPHNMAVTKMAGWSITVLLTRGLLPACWESVTG